MTHVQSVLDAHPKDPEGVAGDDHYGHHASVYGHGQLSAAPWGGVSAAAPTFLTSLN
ncbi:hypothetical protein LR392_14600 [Arthrobacter sp. AK04]|jgi:hypothetical protein|uniref:hypothetical protein n=1 Tax=Arthrobacter sp. AK04 TaxID=2900048 RepID=UPI001E4F8965|nr:hypothetical protein [Arthrobacter sp. AK04]MCD5343456.1 hypothetical protein [Arthrobacter sp. AK04]